MSKAKAAALVIFFLVLTTACGLPPVHELKTGRYIMQGTEVIDLAYVDLLAEQRFVFNRHIATSYRPMGTYSLHEGELILHGNPEEAYVFTVEGDRLIFKAGTTLVPAGAVFKLQAE